MHLELIARTRRRTQVNLAIDSLSFDGPFLRVTSSKGTSAEKLNELLGAAVTRENSGFLFIPMAIVRLIVLDDCTFLNVG